MNILYVVARSVEINTSSSIRNNATISGLLSNGHNVTLVSASPDTSHKAYDPKLRPQGVEVKYISLGGAQKVSQLAKNRTLHKILRSIYFAFKKPDIYDNLKGVINHVKEVDIDSFDLIISSSDPKSSHLFVDHLLKINKKHIPWVQIWGDPFADDISCKNMDLKRVADEERRLLSLADKIIYVSKLSCESQKRRYAESADKMFYFPIPYSEKRISTRLFPTNDSEIQLCYCGDYGSHIRNLIPLYEAVGKVGFKMTICGMSDVVLDNTENITVLPRQNANVVRKHEDNSDVLIHLSNLKGSQIPGKIYQYASTNKTILFILDGDKESLRNAFEKYNRFIFADNNVTSIEKALMSIRQLREKVSNEPIAEFEANNVAREIIKID